jgi:uncharacterized protein YcbK (DUF882 family)
MRMQASRRHFISTLAAAAPALLLRPLDAAGSRALTFNHLHTGERLTVEYFTGDAYVPDALRAIDHLLRDFRTGDVRTIDRNLLDLLHRLAAVNGTRRPFEVISGYRSPATNTMLRAKSEGVASSSLHMQGQAIDIRVPGVPLDTLRDGALALHRGGVGFYPRSGFVHVDTGRVRRW